MTIGEVSGAGVDQAARAVRRGIGVIRPEVTDTCSGMKQEMRKKAHEPVFATKPVGKGTGPRPAIVPALLARPEQQIVTYVNDSTPAVLSIGQRLPTALRAHDRRAGLPEHAFGRGRRGN